MIESEHKKKNKRLVDPGEVENQDQEKLGADKAFDLSLRPKSLSEFIGQQRIKENLQIFMDAAKGRKEAIERSGDLAAILTNLEPGDILFIDEIHRLNKVIEEVLYPAMEDYALDIVIGKGPSARTLRLELPKFTIIGATTKVSSLSSPLRDRFGNIYHLDFYHENEIEHIVKRSATILKTTLEPQAAKHISSRARKTPRVANRLLKRVRDFAQVKGDGTITEPITIEALKMLDVDDRGLDQIDRRILQTIIEKFSGGPVGLNTIAAATGEEMATIEDVYEPFLIQCGLLKRTGQGRVATEAAYQHLDHTQPQSQDSLL